MNHIPDYIQSHINMGDENKINKTYEEYKKYKNDKISKTPDREISYRTKNFKNLSHINFYKKENDNTKNNLSRSIVDYRNAEIPGSSKSTLNKIREPTLHVILIYSGTIGKL
jgi:hypothetical protein